MMISGRKAGRLRLLHLPGDHKGGRVNDVFLHHLVDCVW